MSFSRLLVLATVATAARAQTLPVASDPSPVELSQFVVSAHPYARSAADVAAPTVSLGGPQLDRQQATTLGQLLSEQVGVSSTYFGPGASRPIVRGLGGPRVAVLQNGADTLDASAVSPDHAVSLDPLLIDRVEIVRGPSALMQGSAAMGGAINVVTHRINETLPDAPLAARVESRLGSAAAERSAGAMLDGAWGQLAWHLDGFRHTTSDVAIPGHAYSPAALAEAAGAGAAIPPAGLLPNSATTANGGAGGLSWIGDSGYIGFSFNGFNTRYGVPISPSSDEGPVAIDLRQRHLDLQGEWREPLSGLRAIQFQFGRADYQHTEFDGPDAGTVFTNQGFDSRIAVLHQPWAGWTGTAGAQGERSAFTAAGDEAFLPPTLTRKGALFLFEEHPGKTLTWQLGTRVEHQIITATDHSGWSNRATALSASAGAVWTLDPAWTLALSLAHTNRLPNAQELYADGPHGGTNAYEIGDPALTRETAHGVDLSLRRRRGRVTGELTAFLNRFDGYVYENPTGAEADGLPVYAFVQRDAQFHGVELSTVTHLHGPTDVDPRAPQWDLTLAGDLVRARNTTDDQNLPRTTPARLRAALDWAQGAWQAGTAVSHTFTQDRVAAGESRTDGYTLVSAYVGWRLARATTTWDLLLRGSNLTDAEARVATSFLKDVSPLPGRDLTLSVRLNY